MSSDALVDFRWGWDEEIFRAINGLGWDWLDALFAAASSRPLGLLAALAMLGWIVAVHKRGSVLALAQAAAAVGLADSIGSRLLKPTIGRMRPSFALPEHVVRVISPAANVGSMPSLHSANAFALATVVTLAVPRAGLVALPLATLIAVSRVGVGVHWPSDVLVGAVYGAAVGAGVVFVSRALLKRVRGSALPATQPQAEAQQPDRPA
ncbi:MAG: phosphatase PAP2 family protein [Myxococcaceae bacterium]|nr:phosphatase PAP2 family protein [Myxococcaceae bacterium]